MTDSDTTRVARTSRDAARKEISPMLQNAVWNRLPTAPTKAPQKRSWLPALATGAVGVSALGAAVWTAALWLPGAPLAPAPAFAQVEKAMQEVQTAEWTEHIEGSTTFPVAKTGTVRTYAFNPETTYFKMRLGDSPCVVSTEVPTVNNAGWKTVNNGRIVFASHVDGLRHEYRRYAAENRFIAGANATPAERIRSLVLFPRTEAATADASEVRDDKFDSWDVRIIRTPWVSHPDTVLGSPALRWESDWTYKSSRVPMTPRVRKIRIWVDPGTYRVIRREEEDSHRSGQSEFFWKRVSDNYRYNVPLRPEDFTITPPPVGVAFGYRDFTAPSRMSKSMTDREQQDIRSVITQAVRAWDRHDAGTFLRFWDFDFDRKQSVVYHGVRLTDNQVQENARHWRARATQGIPYRRWSVSDIRFAGRDQSLYVRQSAQEPFPPKSDLNVFAATVSGQVQLENGTTTPADATVTLRKGKDGMKITYINMYNHPLAKLSSRK